MIARPGDEQPEREPDEALARVVLGDEQRVLAERRAARRRSRVAGVVPVSPGCEADGLELLGDRACRRRSVPIDPVRQERAATAAPSAAALEEQLEPDVAPGHARSSPYGKPGGLRRSAAPGRVPQRPAGPVADHDVGRRPEAVLVERVAGDRRAGR